MNSVLLDLRTAIRSFRRRPAFALAVMVTLALGMAPNCTIFAIMDSVYFRPLPYPAQDRLALLNLASNTPGALDPVDGFTFVEWQGRLRNVATMAAYRNAAFTLNEGDRPERVAGQMVTARFFDTLGMSPVRGRAFRDQDSRPGAPVVLVISDRTWREYFSARPDIVGLSLRVDGVPATVVGVAAPGFVSFMEGRAASAWAPLRTPGAAEPPASPKDHATTGDRWAGNVVARLAPRATVDGLQHELESAHRDLTRAFPGFYAGRRPVARDFRQSLFGGLGPGLRLLSMMVALLLLIACGNAANLLLARGLRRTREVALRTALGARRLRLVREAIVESLVLAAGAALLGLALTYAGTRVLWATTAPIFQVIGVNAIAFDNRIVVFAVLLTLAATVLFGVLPSLRGTRTDVAEGLRQGQGWSTRGARRLRLSRALVVAQVTLCMVTLIGTVLVVRGFFHYSRLSGDPGFRVQGLVVASLPRPGAFAEASAPRSAFLQEVERRAAAIPGVRGVAMTSAVPFLDGGTQVSVSRSGAGGKDGNQDRVQAHLRAVDGNFFTTMSVPLVKGRSFARTDDANAAPVAVIGERLARTQWKKADPVGDRVLVDGTWRTVVGVAASTQPSPFRPAAPDVYVPYLQAPSPGIKLLVRSDQPLASLVPSIRAAVASVDPDQAVAEVSTAAESLSAFMTPFRLILVLMGLFGATALALAAVGLYGVMAHDVSRRTREIGVRLALGARREQVVRMVVRDGVRLSSVGLVLGLLLGAAMATILPSEIFGTSGLSPAHYAAAATLWLAVAVTAALVPARRASRVEPATTLRAE